MPRFLCVDYGAKRIGLAVSDLGATMAFPRPAESNPGKLPLAAELVVKRAREWEVDEVVVGLALETSGVHGKQADRMASFAGLLRKGLDGKPVTMWDERLSSVEASSRLTEAGHSVRKQRGLIDSAAAAVILQDFLDSRTRHMKAGSEQGSSQGGDP